MYSYKFIPISNVIAEKIRRNRRDEYRQTDIPTTQVKYEHSSPCRLCLQDAKVGESVLLFSYSPFSSESPYRSIGPIFIHADSCTAHQGFNLPELLRLRLLSLRAYNNADHMIDSEVADGQEIESIIEPFFVNPKVSVIHVHSA